MQSEGILAKYGPVSFVSDAKHPVPMTAHPTEVAERDTWEPAPLIRTRAQQLRFEVVRCQVARRRNPRENAAAGAAVGGLGLGVAGWVAGVALAPATGGISIPAVFLGGILVGVAAGGGLGAALPLHLTLGQFSTVRLRLFKKIGVVATDRESERIVKALQTGLVVGDDRQRYIFNWDRLEEALAPLGLDPTTHERAVEALTIIRDEGPVYDTLVVCRQLLANSMQAIAMNWKAGSQEVEQRDTCARLLKRVDESLSNFGDQPVQQPDRLISEATLLLAELNGVASSPEPLITQVTAPTAPAALAPPPWAVPPPPFAVPARPASSLAAAPPTAAPSAAAAFPAAPSAAAAFPAAPTAAPSAAAAFPAAPTAAAPDGPGVRAVSQNATTPSKTAPQRTFSAPLPQRGAATRATAPRRTLSMPAASGASPA